MLHSLLVAAAFTFVVALPGAAQAATYKRCQNVVIRQGGQIYTQTDKLRAKGTSCKQARKIARRFLQGSEGSEGQPRPYGFICRHVTGGVSCKKSRRVVRWNWKAS